MPIRLNGSTSGYTELSAPAVAGNNSIALPTGNGSAYQILRNGATAGSLEYVDNLVLGTAQNSTSGTSIDFTGIPSWAKRVTVMLNGVSVNGSSNHQIQIGAGSVDATGYISSAAKCFNNGANVGTSTTGFIMTNGVIAADLFYGTMTLTLIGANTWVATFVTSFQIAAGAAHFGGGAKTLSGTLDRVRITTVNGTDTFDAGSINILYE